MQHVDVGDRIRNLRETREMSQIELAKIIGINNSVLSRIESGKRDVEDFLLVKFAEYFKVTSDYLLGRTNAPSPRELPDTVAPYLPEGFDELSPEARKEVLDFIDYIMVKYAKEEDKKKD